ncbi:MAG: VPLPA-CTERM sorting domain-containing protein [Marinicaulis sp.]|nr:VPLPA-CTERM sorting domain-containing protein [Marinicaulis sp.]
MKKQFVSMIAASCMLAGANAFALTVSETAEFSNELLLTSENIGALDAGVNTISGSLEGFCLVRIPPSGNSCTGSGLVESDFADAMIFELGSGQAIVAAELEVTNLTAPDGLSIGLISRTDSPVFGLDGLNPELFTNILVAEGIRVLILPGEVIGDLFGMRVEVDSSSTGDFSLDWTVRLTVEDTAPEIPLPAAWILFMGGVAGMTAMRRRKEN